MAPRSFFLSGMVGLICVVAGCARQTYLIPPISDAQRAFYEIRRLHEEGDSGKVLQKSGEFLKSGPPEELARGVHYYRAFQLERLGEKGEARKEYRWLAEQYPGSEWAALARSHLRTMDE